MRRNKMCGILNLTESRLATYPLTLYRPIASLPFCSRYRLIDLPLTNLTTAGVETIGVFTHDNLRSIYDHVRSGKEWGLDSIHGGLFFFSDPGTDGNRNGVNHEGDIYNYFNNIAFFDKSESEYTVIMGTRMLCNIDVKAVLRHHIEQGAEITVVYKSTSVQDNEDKNASCLTIDEDGHVRGLKSCGMSESKGQLFINMDIYILKTELVTKLIRNAVAENEHCNLNDVLHQAIVNLPSNGFEYTGYLRNINSVEAYYQANMDMLEERNMTALLKGSQSIHTKVKNEAPTFYSRSSDVEDSLVANGCIIHGEVAHSVIFRNVTIEKNTVVNSSIIMQGSSIGSGAELHYVILDKQVRIEPNTKLIGTKNKPIVIEKNSVISRISEGVTSEMAQMKSQENRVNKQDVDTLFTHK
ncbi:glucose-1-phosphate adenylyltransferase subunit GlgD [Sporolactobacillus shoreicorticis]|uniref:Glucose-1-phosphate adenylyltransferase subunit GlgD n=1 Tax=Sporolactobacillus shoreicorticis TaxID=1923877 RepID=A0ABW5RZV3_9BACL|nr:glucose-1-phosphate adenylyltransferase subunit GlgD [Sporolactobacillus shoreicorticis]MCO7127016.1 glucose-1-phosphate adenylyltransferase subunit GlgD [Sporolactobacillus shoreicorticis]